MKHYYIFILSLLSILPAMAIGSASETGAATRWQITDDGSIVWQVKAGERHNDHIEMSGRQMSVVLRYGIDAEGKFCLNRSLVFPMLRLKPNKTGCNLKQRWDMDIARMITADDMTLLAEQVSNIRLRGSMTVSSTFGLIRRRKLTPGVLSLTRRLYPSPDQAEYINPIFPYLGYDIGNESVMNSFRHFARFMNDDYRPIPSSIISEGVGTWKGAKDRGDGAMIAYGAARYALASGNRADAEALWPLISWCLEYCKRKLTADGVPASDSDELENRFPAGDANLCTASLYYDALRSAAMLCRELGKPMAMASSYTKQADALRIAIEKHFGADMAGYHTYRYYNGNTLLRSWICIPLTVGIYDRSAGTVDALYSDRLWTGDGLLTQEGSETYWDRSTLYLFRGALAAGHTDRVMPYLQSYSARRLLGDHVPYAIEAWPEGNQRHLSAESGLYCRVFTEGLFGLRPTGLRRFTITPHLPAAWDKAALRHIRAHGGDFDLCVERKGSSLLVTVSDSKRGVIMKKQIKEGKSVEVKV